MKVCSHTVKSFGETWAFVKFYVTITTNVFYNTLVEQWNIYSLMGLTYNNVVPSK